MARRGGSRGRGLSRASAPGRGDALRATALQDESMESPAETCDPSRPAVPVVQTCGPTRGAWSRGPPLGAGRGRVPQSAGPPPGLMPPAQPPAPPPAPSSAPSSAQPSSPIPAAERVPTAAAPSGDSREGRRLCEEDLRHALKEIFKGEPPAVRKREQAGREGCPIDLVLNMFDVKLPSGLVYHYDVEIYSVKSFVSAKSDVPEERRSRCAATIVNRRVIEAFSRAYQKELGSALLAFDGRKNIYTRKKLSGPDHSDGHFYNNVDLEENGEKRVFVVGLRRVATISFDGLNAVYDGKQIGFDNFQDAVQAADVILRTGPTLSFIPVGRSFFSPPKPNIDGNSDLGGFREAWSGFYSSIRLGQWKPLVNIDMSTTAFFKAGPLLDLVADLLRKRDANELARSELSDRDRVVVSREIKTLKVTATHLDCKKQQKIEGLTRRSANQESFEWEGNVVTISMYFLRKYNIRLRFPNLPCVVLGKKRTMLPMELCAICPGQHCKRKLNEFQTANMIRKTAIPPKSRFERIRNSVKDLENTSKRFLSEFDMRIGTAPIEVRGRVLPAPMIKYGAGRMQAVKNGTWNTDVFYRAAEMKKWAVVNLGRESNEKLRGMVRHLQQEGSKLGMRIEEPRFVGQYGNRANVRRVLEDVKNKVPDMDMAVVVLDQASPYGTIKAEAETTDLCMRTQCVKHRNVETKMNPMFACNLLQKMNTKLGGQNNGVGQVVLDHFKEPFMVVGMDVNHPAPNDADTPSVAAMVASMDSVPSQYHSCTSVQINRRGQSQEYIVDTEGMFFECLSVFRKRTNVLPKRVFIFRDGISEGQFCAVRMYEIGAIRKACLRIDPNYTPFVTFIVVQKRHHVRMKPKFDRDGVGRAGNVPPGTILDTHIVHPEIFDFYLCSQQGIQGTSRPAHYHVVHDDNCHKPDEIYRLCYYLCHTYARCARTVSIPAPAYYAHLAAFRAKEHMKGLLQDGINGSHSSSDRSSINAEMLRRFQAAQKVNPEMRSKMYFV